MTCDICKEPCGVAREVAGKMVCMACNPFKRCEACAGMLEHRGIPNWMNRFVCRACGKEVSR